MWANGSREDSLSFLRQFSASLARDLQVETKENSQRPGVNKHKLDELSRLLARCYFKQGQWQVELKEDWGEVSLSCVHPISVPDLLRSEMLKIFCIHISLPHTTIPTGTRHGIRGLSQTSKSLDTWKVRRKALLLMYRVAVWLLTSCKQFKVSIIGIRDNRSLIWYPTGFFRSIALRNENALQDTLRLLTLWFKFGAHDDVSQAMGSGFSVVEVDTWLEVIPQVSIV